TLAVRVVGMANSPAYMRREPVASISDAAMVLGRQAISIVALSFSLAQGLQRTGSPAGLDLDQFWRRSLTTAAIARHLARSLFKAKAEEAFLAGLLCNLGKLVLAQKVADLYGPIVESTDGWPTLEAEEEQLGWTSLDVSLAVLREWNMAESVVSAIEAGVDPSRADTADTISELAPLIVLATAVDASIHNLDDPASHQLVEERFRAVFGQDESVLGGLDAALAEASEMMDIPLPEGVNGDDLLAQARERMLAATVSVANENNDQARRLEELGRQNTELSERAATDVLTGLPNRRSFDEAMDREAGRRNRGHIVGSLGVLMLDIDHFKSLNDTYGHSFGDEVLHEVAQSMRSVVRAEETLHRYGGEEFVLLAPSCNAKALNTVANRLRQTVESLELEFEGAPVKVTISAGAACASDVTDNQDAKRLLQKADSLLYRAKKNGRNRVEVSEEEAL
ncbi:MAG: diguanylate cyclase, partial [Actinomycetota bacterium]|nr:diguanylate cyclase [Actinomycetota bacterium]